MSRADTDLAVEARVANERPSAVVAYALWALLGYLGAHRLYLRRFGSGLSMAALFGIGTLTAPILIGWVPLIIVGVWWVLDLVLTASIITARTDEIRREVSRDMTGT